MTETRAEKARRLLDERSVILLTTDSPIVRASVRGDTAVYRVYLYPNGHYFCECAWGHFHSYTDDLCAHALALRLAVERKDKPC